MTMAAGRFRRCETYIGGEHLDETYIRGEASGSSRYVEVTGANFYDAVEQLPGLRHLYGFERRKLFDIYHVGAKTALFFAVLIRRAHTGALPLYLTWLVGGALVLLYVITQVGTGHD